MAKAARKTNSQGASFSKSTSQPQLYHFSAYGPIIISAHSPQTRESPGSTANASNGKTAA